MSTDFYQIVSRSLLIAGTALLLAAAPDSNIPASRYSRSPLAVWTDTLPDRPKRETARSGTGIKRDWRDYYRNRFVEPRPRSSFYQKEPSNVSTKIMLSPSGKLLISEEVRTDKGSLEYRPAEEMDMEVYNEIQNKRAFNSLLRDYAARSDGQSALGAKRLLPKLDLPPSLDHLLGNELMDILPNGFVTLDLGFMNQFNDNPAIPVRQRRNFDFIFKPQININFNAKISERLGFLTNYDTKASFKFENALRLNYKGPEESFIRKLEAGNVNWMINSQLIPGVQNLFGLKTEFQFGKLNATVVASQQRSRKERIVLRGGAQAREFEIKSDTYEENRHFFLSHFFRNQYESWTRSLPNITSPVTVTRLEVYVTNRTAATSTLRNVVGLASLAENTDGTPSDMKSDPLYQSLLSNPAFRQVDQTNNALANAPFSLRKNVDFELLRGAKKLSQDREYTFNRQLGYISLTVPLRNDEILAVAYEYTYRGRTYKVGELTEDYQNLRDDEVIALKLLKSSTIRNDTSLPMWDLMMKNIYSLGGTQIDRQRFQLRIIYKDDVTGIDNPNLQEGRRLKNQPLVRLMQLDRLNSVNDLQPDGNFDYVEGYTIDSQNGRIIFPVLEPFGSTMAQYFDPDEAALAQKYVFSELYRSTMIEAQQVNEKNKYYLKGSYQSAGGTDIQLPFGVAEESVTVTSGGAALSRGSDFIVEAQMGRVRIVNPSVLNSGREIVVEYEKPDLFDNQIRTLLGTRLEYTLNRDVSLGMTAMRYRETPAGFLSRVALGNEPADNSIIGIDGSIRKEAPFLTKLLDKLPLIQTKEMSYIHFRGEGAQLFPGVNRRVRDRSLIDDFETARTVYDLTRQPTKWRVGATPQNSPKFSFAGAASQGLDHAYNRAKISVYNVDNIFSGDNFGANVAVPLLPEDGRIENYYERLYLPQDLFPGRPVPVINLPQNVLDVAYYPSERGMYNYNTDLDINGRLKNPQNNYGAVTRAITSDNDFDNANIETIDFWLLNPFITSENGKVRAGYRDASGNSLDRVATGGKLVFNLGDISEDIIPDERYNFENGLPVGERVVGVNVDSTAWGYVTRQQFVINAFSNEAGARERQDVGLDGMSTRDEQSFFSQQYLDRIRNVVSPGALAEINADPSADDFAFYLGEEWDAQRANVLQRYKNFMGMENNSPESTGNRNTVTQANNNLPDGEDMNTDNTINSNEEYYEYEIDLQPGQLEVGKGYIVDRTSVGEADWYLFRIPVREFTNKTSGMNSFKSIRFMRMYLTEFENPVVLRFAQLQLVGQQYRKYTYDLNTEGGQEVPEPYDARFTVGTVSIEENSQSTGATDKYVYAVPPGWERDRDFTQPNQNFQLNEQAMSMCVTDLRDGDSRAVFKNVNLDLQFRKRLRMYVHMHSEESLLTGTGVFMRLGTDATQNYYEIERVSLVATRPGEAAPSAVWPEANEINFAFQDLLDTKSIRNQQWGRSYSSPFSMMSSDGIYKITVVGNPDLSLVRVVMIGMRNPVSEDKRPQSFCLWVNEMHVEGFDQTAGWSAVGQLDAKLADLAIIKATGRIETFGFGGVQTRIGERSRAVTSEFGLVSNVSVDKFLPQSWGFSIPLFLNYDRQQVTPYFDPLDPDMKLSASLDNLRNAQEREHYRRMVVDQTTRRGINLSNVRKTRTNTQRPARLYDFENFSFTYAFNDVKKTNILTESFLQQMYKGGIAYAFSKTPQPFEPFKKWQSDNRYVNFIKEFNLALMPSSIEMRADVERNFIRTQLRNSDLTTEGMDPYFEKFFWFNRHYDLRWNLTRNAVVSYHASARAMVDEPYGDLDTQEKRDSLWTNFKRLGRIKDFDQRITLTYRLPLDKLPLTDWISADYNHQITYNFMANAFGAVDENGVEFGNIIRNGRERGISGKVDFVALYNKLKYLRFANAPNTPRKNFTRSPGDIEEIEGQSSPVLKNLTRVLMTVRGINVSYSVAESTALPGFLSSPRYFGLDNTGAPGLGFVLGEQARDFQKTAAAKGWLSRSVVLNQPFQQTIEKRFNANTSLEPFRDFQINIKADYTRRDAYQEFYRPSVDTLGNTGSFESQSPLRNGQYSMTFLSFRTALAKMNRNHDSPVFNNFIKYREIIMDRLNSDPGNIGEGTYNKNSQDVLIPSFFAAYSGRGADSTGRIRTNPFLRWPFPNWSVRYNGLSQMPAFKKLFAAFTLEHNYTSNYSVGNFTSSLNYEELYVNLAVTGYLMASNLLNNDPRYRHLNENGHYIPVFAMSTITMSERFSPLIGVNFRTQSRITGRIDYNRDRTVALNLANTQMEELFNQDLTISAGFTRNNMALPFKINGVKRRLKNDLTAQLSVTFRDTRSIQRKIVEIEENGIKRDVAENIPTAGNINFQLRPTINYVVSNRMSLQFYFERMFNDPLVSNSFYRSTTSGGVQLRFNLAE